MVGEQTVSDAQKRVILLPAPVARELMSQVSTAQVDGSEEEAAGTSTRGHGLRTHCDES